jgi:hypothetical protein
MGISNVVNGGTTVHLKKISTISKYILLVAAIIEQLLM